MIRTTIAYLWVALYIVLLGPLGMLWTMLRGDSTLIYNLARACVRVAGWLCGVRVRVHGLGRIQAGQNYVFLSNHQGNFDGPALFYAIPRDLRALIKQEMMRIPVLSLILKQVGFVPIDRSDPRKARAALETAVHRLRQGYSFFAFPEGTRSRNGRLGEFKKGAFHMALSAGVPIIPTSVVNSSSIQPPGAYRIQPGVIDVVFHEPITAAGHGAAERDAVVESTRRAIASALPGGADATGANSASSL